MWPTYFDCYLDILFGSLKFTYRIRSLDNAFKIVSISWDCVCLWNKQKKELHNFNPKLHCWRGATFRPLFGCWKSGVTNEPMEL